MIEFAAVNGEKKPFKDHVAEDDFGRVDEQHVAETLAASQNAENDSSNIFSGHEADSSCDAFESFIGFGRSNVDIYRSDLQGEDDRGKSRYLKSYSDSASEGQ